MFDNVHVTAYKKVFCLLYVFSQFTDECQQDLTTSTRSDLSLSMRSNDSVAAVMPSYIKGQPMPNPCYCLFMQSHAGKTVKQKFLDILKRKSKYYSLVLTKDLVVCVSDRSSNVIEFTVDLCKDEYVHEKGELEDKLHVHKNGEELCFNTSTTPILHEKICKSEYQRHII